MYRNCPTFSSPPRSSAVPNAAAWERSVADAMALTMLSTALPPPVGASSKNGLDEAKPAAFFGGCPSVAYISLSVANS